MADVVVSCLRDAGVRALFGVPGGGSNLDLIDAGRRAGLPFVLTATETAGAIAAIAQAEISGAPGACLTGLGPGAASVANGAACAHLDRAPLIVITDAHPTAAGRFEHQRIDQRALLAPVTKWSATLTGDHAGRVIAEAIARAMEPPRGPVHIECPADVGSVVSEHLSVVGRQASVRSTQSPAVGLKIEGWRPAAVRRPLLLAGLGARAPEDVAAIRAFCVSHHVPAMVTYKAKGVVPDEDEHFAGVFTNGAIERAIVAQSDLLIGAGLDRVELLPRDWTYPQPMVDLDGDIAAGLRQLAGRLPPSEWDLRAVRQAVDAQRQRLRAAGRGLTPDAVVRVVHDRTPGARVTVDAGAHMFPATMLWPCRAPGDMLISNGLSTMGFAVPAAAGAALIDRERRVVALTGDGGLLMCAGELATLARERLPVIVVVFDDESLSLIDVKQRQRQFDRLGVALGRVRWSAIAEGLGVRGHTAATEGELQDALADAAANPGPTLIDARIDGRAYAEMVRAVRG